MGRPGPTHARPVCSIVFVLDRVYFKYVSNISNRVLVHPLQRKVRTFLSGLRKFRLDAGASIVMM